MERYSAFILAGVGALLYFTGWAYLYTYFEYFGISLIEVDPSIQFVFMHALTPLWVLLENWRWGTVLLILAVYAIIVILLDRLLRHPKIYAAAHRAFYSNWGAPVLAFLALALTFFAILQLGLWAGRHKAAAKWAEPITVVRFNFHSVNAQERNLADLNLAALNDNLLLKYLMSTSVFHYAFYRETGCRDPHCGLIFKIPVGGVDELVIIHE